MMHGASAATEARNRMLLAGLRPVDTGNCRGTYTGSAVWADPDRFNNINDMKTQNDKRGSLHRHKSGSVLTAFDCLAPMNFIKRTSQFVLGPHYPPTKWPIKLLGAIQDYGQVTPFWDYRRGVKHGGVDETPRASRPVPGQPCSTVTDTGAHYDHRVVREGCFPIHRKGSTASQGPDGFSLADSALHPGPDCVFPAGNTNTSATVHQSQTVICKDAHGVPSVIENDADGQLSEASTANGNSDTGTDSELRDHERHNNDDQVASGVARPESGGTSIKNDLNLEGISPLFEPPDDSDTKASSATEGRSSNLEDMPPLVETSDDSELEATDRADLDITVRTNQKATRTKKAAANLVKLSRRPVGFADEAMQHFKQLDHNASLDNLAPGHSSVGRVV